LRDGYFFGMGAVSIACYLLVCSISWILGTLNMLLYIAMNFNFMQGNEWIKMLAYEYAICSLILTAFMIFLNY
jgi:hypothetical protein